VRSRIAQRVTSTCVIALMASIAVAFIGGCPKTDEDVDVSSRTPRPRSGAAEGPVRIAMIPKLKTIPFFLAAEEGAKQAAAELGDKVELLYDGPTEDSAARQVEMVESFIAQGVDVIAVAPNDPDAIASSLKKANAEGIIPMTWDADANPEESGRVFFVNQVRARDLAFVLMDEMARQAGDDAKYAIIIGSHTAANQQIWMEHMRERRDEKYPAMEELAVEAPGEDLAKATRTAQDLLKRHPDIDGIFGITSVSCPAAAEAVIKAGVQDRVKVVGLAMPSVMREWIKEGDIETTVLWDVEDLGYLTVYAAYAFAAGELMAEDTTFDAGRIGEVDIEDGHIILGDPLVFNASNIDAYDF